MVHCPPRFQCAGHAVLRRTLNGMGGFDERRELGFAPGQGRTVRKSAHDKTPNGGKGNRP
jgi:hypothetical protein